RDVHVEELSADVAAVDARAPGQLGGQHPVLVCVQRADVLEKERVFSDPRTRADEPVSVRLGDLPGREPGGRIGLDVLVSRARIWLAAATLGLAAAPGARAFTSGQGGGTSPDEALWAEIVAL